MSHEPKRSPRRALNLSIESSLLDEAKALGMNLSRVVEVALRREVAAEKARRWREENAEAIAFNNAELERNGLWSDGLRLF